MEALILFQDKLMKTGDLVEIYGGTMCPKEIGVYLELDFNSAWEDGEEENYSRAMILIDGEIDSVPLSQCEVLREGG